MSGTVLEAFSSPKKMSIALECRTKKMFKGTSGQNRQLEGSQKEKARRMREEERGRAGSEREVGKKGEKGRSTD